MVVTDWRLTVRLRSPSVPVGGARVGCLCFKFVVTEVSNKHSALAGGVVWSLIVLAVLGCDATLKFYRVPLEKEVSFDRWVTGQKVISAKQIILHITNAERHGYTLKRMSVDNASLARVSGSKSGTEVTLLRPGNFTADIVLEHANYEDYMLKNCEFEVIVPSFRFHKLVRDVAGGTKVGAVEILGQVYGAKEGYQLKSITVNNGTYARVTDLGLELFKVGKFTADLVLEHANYLDATIKGAEFEVGVPSFRFSKLVRGVTGGTKVGAVEILGHIYGAKEGYQLKSITVNDASYARVTSAKPNLGLELLKVGNFTADVVLEHANYFDVTIKGAEFEVGVPSFRFSKLVRGVTGGTKVGAVEILGHISDAKVKGYQLKSITVNDASYARVTSAKPNLGLELLKVGNFTADVVLEHANYFDVTIKGAEFEVGVPSFRFSKLVRGVTGGTKVGAVEILGHIYGAKEGYQLKSITVNDASYARVTSAKPNLGLELLKVGNFTADVVLEHANYFDVTIKGAKFVNILFDKTYGGRGYDEFSSIIEDSDGHIWLAGSTSSKGSGSRDGWVLKLDKSDGSVLLEKTYGGGGNDRVNSIIEDSDGHIWLAGSTNSKGSGGDDGWVLKLDKSAGGILLEKTYGSSRADEVNSIIEDSDGHIWLGGYKGGGDWVLKLDKSDGSVLLERAYGRGDNERLNSIIEDSDGHIWLGGINNRSIGSGYDGWVLKLDKSDGRILLEKTYGGGNHDNVRSIIEDSDGHIWLVGMNRSRGSGGDDGWVLKLDKSDGRILLEKTYGGGRDDRVNSIIEDSDGHIWLGGEAGGIDPTAHYDGWVLKLDKSDGSVLFEKTYGGLGSDFVRNIIEGSDGHIWLGGLTWSKGIGLHEGWLLGGVELD